jgi:putative sterol carrier protein
MYANILEDIIEDMADFGLISTIAISYDIYSNMTSKEINHIEGFLTGNIKWLIRNDKNQYYGFIYEEKPQRNLKNV